MQEEQLGSLHLMGPVLFVHILVDPCDPVSLAV